MCTTIHITSYKNYQLESSDAMSRGRYVIILSFILKITALIKFNNFQNTKQYDSMLNGTAIPDVGSSA
jgi:hypothetical protein